MNHSEHMDVAISGAAGDAFVADAVNRMPWFERDTGRFDRAQEQLNAHGMTPGHRRTQQHGISSGIAGQVCAFECVLMWLLLV